MDDKLEVDLEDLSVQEIEDIEEYLDMPMDEMFKAGARRGKVLRAIGWIVKRREDPSFTIEDAGSLKISLSDAKPDPTDAAS